MSDVTTSQATAGPRTTALRLGPAPQLRVKSYCADCGTWDTHGPVCETCGYDFTGAYCPGEFKPMALPDDDQ